jgi:hypothetical protein
MVGFGNPLTDLRERGGEGRLQRFKEEIRTLGFGSGVFIPQRRIPVVPTQARYYRGFEEIETESPYR